MRSRPRLNQRSRLQVYRGLCVVLALMALFVVPTWPAHLIGGASTYLLSVVGLAAIWAIVAVGTAMFVNLTGLPTLAHAGLWGVGAYASGIAITHLHIGFWPSLAFAAAAPAVVALPLGLISLRTNGVAFLVVTIAFTEFIVLVLTNWSLTGGDAGLAVVQTPGSIGPLSFSGLKGQYYLFLFFLFITLGLYRVVNRSAFGARLRATRDDQALSLSLGINVRWHQLLMFELTAVIVGVAGALLLVNQQAITPGLFASFQFIPIYLALMLGGFTVIAGPALGAWIAQLLPVWIGSADPNVSLLIYGIVLAGSMLVLPMGIMGTLCNWVAKASPPRPEPAAAISSAGGPAQIEPPPAGEPPPIAPSVVPEPVADPPPVRSQPRPVGGILLEAKGIKRWFGANKALDGVDFEVFELEIRGLIGPNGSGKTTLLNCVSGFLPLTDGKVNYRGKQLTGLRPDAIARLGVVRTFQSPHVFASFTVTQTCALAAELAGSRSDSGGRHGPDTESVLRSCGLSVVADVPVAALPYGQARLLGVAAAIASRPRLILLDEPAAGLAPGETEALCSVILDARDHGVSTVVVDHDMSFLLRICDAVTVLDGGKRLAEGRPEEITSNRAVIAAYLGESFVERHSREAAGAASTEPR